MNTIAAVNLLENPLVLAAIVLVGALSNWLMRRRAQNQANASPDGGASPTTPGEPGRSTRQPTLQDALRQLLRGESPTPIPSPPPIPRASYEEQISRVGRDKEQFHTEDEDILLDELPESYEGLRPNGNQVGERSRQPAIVASVRAARFASHEHRENGDCIATISNGQAKHSVRTMRALYRQQSSERGGTFPPWRDPRSARQAFIASLVFAPPKGLEA